MKVIQKAKQIHKLKHRCQRLVARADNTKSMLYQYEIQSLIEDCLHELKGLSVVTYEINISTNKPIPYSLVN